MPRPRSGDRSAGFPLGVVQPPADSTTISEFLDRYGESDVRLFTPRTVVTRERNFLEALLRGWAVIHALVAATLTIVFAIMLVCGAGPGPWAPLAVVTLLLMAATYEFFSRLARTPQTPPTDR